jgi:signal peptidase I
MRKFMRFLLWSAVVIGVMIGVARAFFIRWWRVPLNDPYLEASIEPSLEGGDLILLWRFTKPGFGDLVMCPEPGASGRIVIGRIMAEAGDTVTVDGDQVSLNGKTVETERACDDRVFKAVDPSSTHHQVVEQHCQIETLAGQSHMRGSTSGHKVPPRKTEHEVAPGKVFLVSDNRLFPYDSRDFGTVPRDSCKEMVFFRLVGRKGFFDAKHRFMFVQ